ncbi:hypothetical protein CDL15_Pgr010440 [Punica granatum]|uniref:Uncharacterized protein n=1 Tax=Punica granatum TaxID=22663 RepID=A0A218VXT1_PUNGR|nr:hypothetical protein CDL15_Pgr010440 [Punica granatum]
MRDRPTQGSELEAQHNQGSREPSLVRPGASQSPSLARLEAHCRLLRAHELCLSLRVSFLFYLSSRYPARDASYGHFPSGSVLFSWRSTGNCCQIQWR